MHYKICAPSSTRFAFLFPSRSITLFCRIRTSTGSITYNHVRDWLQNGKFYGLPRNTHTEYIFNDCSVYILIDSIASCWSTWNLFERFWCWEFTFFCEATLRSRFLANISDFRFHLNKWRFPHIPISIDRMRLCRILYRISKHSSSISSQSNLIVVLGVMCRRAQYVIQNRDNSILSFNHC